MNAEKSAKRLYNAKVCALSPIYTSKYLYLA